MNTLNRKTVVVTGASQGLGEAIALCFAACGGHVFINCPRDLAAAQRVVDHIRNADGYAEPFLCDIANETEVRDRFAELNKNCGGIDILINNARIDPYARSATMSDGEWFDQTIAVNLKGAYLTTLAVIDHMKEKRWGRIINISSVWAYWPAKLQMIPYSVSKAGMHALTRGFAKEAAPYGVTVNTVAPGLILTENAAKRLTPEQLAAETATVPLGRGAAPEEIAEIVLHVAQSGFLTGETINANGGAYMGN